MSLRFDFRAVTSSTISVLVRVHDQSYCAVLEYVTLHEVDRLSVQA